MRNTLSQVILIFDCILEKHSVRCQRVNLKQRSLNGKADERSRVVGPGN